MIKQILDATVITDPWNHLLINNIFNQLEIALLIDAVDTLLPLITTGYISTDFQQQKLRLIAAGVNLKVIELVEEKTKLLETNHIDILKKLNNFNSLAKYSVSSQFGFIKNSWHFIHSDNLESNKKAMTFVIYLTPDDAKGTVLYTGPELENFQSIVPWKSNSGFIFAPAADTTWHNYFHYGETARATLNFYIKQE